MESKSQIKNVNFNKIDNETDQTTLASSESENPTKTTEQPQKGKRQASKTKQNKKRVRRKSTTTQYRKCLPVKITAGFTIVQDGRGVLTIDKETVSIRTYQRYDLLNVFQNLWNDVQKRAYEEFKETNLLSDKALRQPYALYANKILSPNKYLSYYLKHYAKPEDEKKREVWQKKYNEYLAQLSVSLFPLDDTYFTEFLERAKQELHSFCTQIYTSATQFRYSWQILTKFVVFINKHYMDSESLYPIPDQPVLIKENPLNIDEGWIKNGKRFNQLVKAVLNHWAIVDTKVSKGDFFTKDETVAWLVFSLLTFGGINDKALLNALVNTLLDKPEFIALDNYHIVVSTRYKTKGYGNERVEVANARRNQLYKTQQVCLDVMSQSWLYRYNILAKSQNDKQSVNIEKLLKNQLSRILGISKHQVPSLTWLLTYASYYWEMLPNTSVNQALVEIMQGRRHTGLLKDDFNNLIDGGYKAKIDQISRPLLLSKVRRRTFQYKESKKVRKLDIIKRIQTELALKHKTRKLKEIHEYDDGEYDIHIVLENMLNKQRDIAETILIQFVLDSARLKPRRQENTLQNYLSSIAYEWVYFLSGQPVLNYDAEDFLDTYEEILDHKAIVRNNLDIQFSARLLQRLHNIGVALYNFPELRLKDAQSQRVVRAEWISPQTYYAILLNLPQVIDPLEVDMYKLLFILAYRTGMRKKELLGLRYKDIEGFALGQPSVVVRPNSYRSTKTQGSIRRVMIYGLLSNREMTFFNQYVTINENKVTDYIFSPSYDKYPIDDSEPLTVFRRLTSLIDSKDYAFHAFRHTCITNLALILNADAELATVLTGYGITHIQEVKKTLLGVNNDSQAHWYAIAGLVGHISPNRSFEYYIHSATLMATYSLSNTTLSLSYEVFKNITGINKSRLKSNQIEIKDNKLSLHNARKLVKKLTLNQHRDLPVWHAINQAQEWDGDLLFDTIKTDDRVYRYSINQLLKFLELLEKTDSIHVSANRAGIKIDDAKIFVTRATKVVNIMTNKGKPRFIKDSNQIVPQDISSRQNYELLPLLLKNFWLLREKSYDDYQWYLNTIIHKTNFNNAYISFAITDTRFLKFVTISRRLLPEKYWMMSGNESVKTAFYSAFKLENNNTLSKIYFKNSHSTTLRFGIFTTDKPVSEGKAFAGLLRFIVHILLILDDSISLDSTDANENKHFT